MNAPPTSRKSIRWLPAVLTVIAVAAVAALIVYKRMAVKREISPLVQQQVAGLVAGLKARGVNVGEPTVLDDIEGAEQVVALDINGKAIRLVELDVTKEKCAQEVAHVRQHHKTKTLGAEQPAEVEGAIIILDFDKHPDKAKIIEAFHKAAAGGK